MSKNPINMRLLSVSLIITLLGLAVYSKSKNDSASLNLKDAEKQMETIKTEMEKPNSSPVLEKKYNRLAEIISDCSPLNQSLKESRVQSPFAPANSLCINGALATADPDYNRPLASSTGTGIGNGTVGNCSLSGTATAANFDVYSFDLTGCAIFPTEITATLCGPAGCQHVGNVDTVLDLYRNVAAGDPLTANGGLPGTFNPASPCTNARAGSDDLGTTSGTPNNPGGATCNQVVGANCVAPCTSPSNAGALSGFRRQLGSGTFVLVVAGFGNTTVGNYNLYVDAPAAGCSILRTPTAAGANLGGRVARADGSGIAKAVVTMRNTDTSESIVIRTNPFGYYNFENLAVGTTYIVTVESKNYTFANPNQVVTLQDNAADVNFISHE